MLRVGFAGSRAIVTKGGEAPTLKIRGVLILEIGAVLTLEREDLGILILTILSILILKSLY